MHNPINTTQYKKQQPKPETRRTSFLVPVRLAKKTLLLTAKWGSEA
jgi:hypothetical protein